MIAPVLPEEIVRRVTARCGRRHPFDRLVPARTALVVVDMQNYFMKPGYLGEVSGARQIVPQINKLAAGLRERGGHIVWIKTASNGTQQSWSVLHEDLLKQDISRERYRTLDESHEGHALWHELDVRPPDAQIIKKKYSAFAEASSLEAHLRT